MVVHTGYNCLSGTDLQALYAGERLNIDMKHRVYELALETGVRRSVAASTNLVAKWYEGPHFAGLRDRVSPEDYPSPNSFYGWAKAAYDSLGFLYTCGSLGRKLEVILLRIVAPREIEAKDFIDKPRQRYIRDVAGYLSERDLQQLFYKPVGTPGIEDDYGVPFHIFYGVSNNVRTFWSITNARKVIGYVPEDNLRDALRQRYRPAAPRGFKTQLGTEHPHDLLRSLICAS